MKPLVSVIVPAYNSSLYIRESLLSVLAQSEKSLELIVVDDGSTDNQNEIISELAVKDNRIKLIKQENRGVSAARNHGFKVSSGTYAAFMDADDVWLPDNLALKMAKIQAGRFGLVHSDAAVIDAASKKTGDLLQGEEGSLLNNMLAWRGTQVPGPSSILIPRETIEKVGLFDENLSTSADNDFFIRVATVFSIGRVDKITWYYRMHAQNMHKNLVRMEHDVLYVFNKARKNNLFYSEKFARECFGKTYMVLALSWMGDGRSYRKGLPFLGKAIANDPRLLKELLTKVYKYIRS